MNSYPASPPEALRLSGGFSARLRRIEAWMDDRGRKAWIAAMVLGFIFAWPVGLGLLAYITFTNRWSKTMFKGSACAHRHHGGWAAHRAYRSSGNSAFDAYKTDTLRRLEDEQQAFEAFLQRLRDAKDKSEFDSFMEDRAKSNQASGQDSPRGEY
jgi:hypothetical protein